MKAENNNALVSKECVQNLLNSVQGSYLNFKPTKFFYKRSGINCRRWAKLVRGELSITIDELKHLCKALNVEFNATTFERQLSIFDKNDKPRNY